MGPFARWAARGVAAWAAIVLLALPARAQTSDAPAPPSAASTEARAHFDSARELYRTGAYREAIRELEAARALDPGGKELVYNLAVIHEKLGEIDDALRELQAYEQMELTPSELDKAQSYERRLEGAKRELALRPRPAVAPAQPPMTSVAETPPEPTSPPETSHGRIDAATLTAGGVMLVSAAVGTVLGIKALTDRPVGFVTGQDGTFADFQHRNELAHDEALATDASFGVSIAAAVVTAILYFGRTTTATDTPPAVSATWLRGGAALSVGGTF